MSSSNSKRKRVAKDVAPDEEEQLEEEESSDDDSTAASEIAAKLKAHISSPTRRTPERKCKKNPAVITGLESVKKTLTKPPSAVKAPKGGRGKGKNGKGKPVTSTKKKRNKNGDVKNEDGATPQRMRATNFTTQEDIWLARAYCASSTNSIIGAGQNTKKFWEKGVQARYSAFANTEVEPDEEGVVSFTNRAHDGLRRRWRTVSADLRQFMACYRWAHSEQRTGFNNEQDYINCAMTEYETRHSTTFKYEHMLGHLTDYPYFNPHITEADAEKQVEEIQSKAKPPPADGSAAAKSNNNNLAMASKISRPPGTKQAKKDYAMAQAISAAEAQKNQHFASLARSQQLLAESVNNRNNIKTHSKLAELFLKAGKMNDFEFHLDKATQLQTDFEAKMKAQEEAEAKANAKADAPKKPPAQVVVNEEDSDASSISNGKPTGKDDNKDNNNDDISRTSSGAPRLTSKMDDESSDSEDDANSGTTSNPKNKTKV